MIANINKTKEILNKYDLRAKKQFGQNFLVDANIIRRIVSEANVNKTCGVIEIGPGIGALTEELANQAKKVLCYEIDSDMVTILKENLNKENVYIKEEDFLKVDLEKDLEYFSDCEEVKVISNLPYYITTPIIFKLLESDNRIKDFYFMVQKEVGDRLTGKPKTKDYNSLSVLIDFQSNARTCFMVGKNCFFPAPNVDSAIIHIEKVKKDYSVNNKADFLKFVQNIFSLRRKTLVNNMSSQYGIKKEDAIEKIKSLGYKETVRSEELVINEMIEIYNEFFVNHK